MQAESILLEPWYEFGLSLPLESVGRAMTDLEKQKAEFELEQNEDKMAVLRGIAPMSEMQDYQQEVVAYTVLVQNFVIQMMISICHSLQMIHSLLLFTLCLYSQLKINSFQL